MYSWPLATRPVSLVRQQALCWDTGTFGHAKSWENCSNWASSYERSWPCPIAPVVRVEESPCVPGSEFLSQTLVVQHLFIPALAAHFGGEGRAGHRSPRGQGSCIPLFIYPSHSFEFFSISRTGSLGIIQSIMHLLWAHYVPRTLLGVGGKQNKHLKIVLSDGKGAFSFPKKTG